MGVPLRAPSLSYSENKAIYTKIRTFSSRPGWTQNIVNGKELNALFVALEDKENGFGRHTKATDMYGHNHFVYMLKNFKSEYAETDGIPLCCCSDCGCDGCWEVSTKIHVGEKEVVWHDFAHSHRPYTYGGLEFHFERSAYDAQIRKLEEWAKNYKS